MVFSAIFMVHIVTGGHFRYHIHPNVPMKHIIIYQNNHLATFCENHSSKPTHVCHARQTGHATRESAFGGRSKVATTHLISIPGPPVAPRMYFYCRNRIRFAGQPGRFRRLFGRRAQIRKALFPSSQNSCISPGIIAETRKISATFVLLFFLVSHKEERTRGQKGKKASSVGSRHLRVAKSTQPEEIFCVKLSKEKQEKE